VQLRSDEVAEAKAYLDRRLVEMEGSEADVKGALQLSLDNAKPA